MTEFWDQVTFDDMDAERVRVSTIKAIHIDMLLHIEERQRTEATHLSHPTTHDIHDQAIMRLDALYLARQINKDDPTGFVRWCEQLQMEIEAAEWFPSPGR